ncbi:ATPase, T2SS/T4P/T4SS family [Campylobacter troglodytis]|uniref:ATPase, T2SS/T4P/T4SS family n=1 Tax=Campylobacter troglodytis TaxID=654363 RepID=UPI00115895C3|nr:ATPase, T2SS/T4P/T4SS family [Campylobacter troglodytis]TQR56269.1 conjugal transfer protein [Campylobacter troglodytis]
MIKYNENINMILAHKLRILDSYLRLEANELIFNRPKELYVDRGDEWELIKDERLDYEFLNDFITQLATLRRQKFNEKNPALSCELPSPYDRYRVQAQHKASLFNSDIMLCIRIPNKQQFELESFELSDKVKSYGWDYEKIRNLIRNKKNVLISGGTGSGKTSFLNSLMKEVNINERVVTIEDSNELHILNPNKTQLAVPKNTNEIYGYQDAINNAVRLRPDRLFLGEIDIRNTFSFLRVNNTGHEGNLSTLHANNPKDAIKAIITNITLGGDLKNPDNNMLKELITTAIDYIIQIKRMNKKRIITDILHLKGAENL